MLVNSGKYFRVVACWNNNHYWNNYKIISEYFDAKHSLQAKVSNIQHSLFYLRIKFQTYIFFGTKVAKTG